CLADRGEELFWRDPRRATGGGEDASGPQHGQGGAVERGISVDCRRHRLLRLRVGGRIEYHQVEALPPLAAGGEILEDVRGDEGVRPGIEAVEFEILAGEEEGGGVAVHARHLRRAVKQKRQREPP